MEGEADFYKLFAIARIETWPISSDLTCTAKRMLQWMYIPFLEWSWLLYRPFCAGIHALPNKMGSHTSLPSSVFCDITWVPWNPLNVYTMGINKYKNQNSLLAAKCWMLNIYQYSTDSGTYNVCEFTQDKLIALCLTFQLCKIWDTSTYFIEFWEENSIRKQMVLSMVLTCKNGCNNNENGRNNCC